MECPTCEKVLSTEQGMRQHHTKVHGVSLPNRECSGCGTAFYDPKAQLQYCEDCNPNAGEHNGNWKGGKERTTCKECDTKFEYYPSNKDGAYCPACVQGAEGLLPIQPMDEVPTTTGECTHCGLEFVASPSRLAGKSYGCFCSQPCYAEWLSENVVGEGHHQWEGGTIRYGQGWYRVRRTALERDQYECQNCGEGADALGRNPDVHHLRPVRSFADPAEAHELDNVVSLCRPCHRRVESGAVTAPEPTTER
ncbi:HNH endonuclease [Haloarchaeobius litoreus]|uniref:HNH endonuclease n=1 Tax=Haloarchaeobius litoreus TaxID=755306 RepID=A0ABD6DHA5_9EURY|nr:HNH endonuclease [Haloarchaeobius litoreus]